MLVNSNYSAKLGPTIKENWLVQIFKNSNSSNLVNNTPDLALCFASQYDKSVATLKNSSNVEIPYYPVIINKPTIKNSLDLKSFTTQTGSITLNLADTDIVIGDSKKRLMEEFGSSYVNAQVNVLSVIDDDTTNANCLQIFSGKISSFTYSGNVIILRVVSSRPFQDTSLPNTKTAGVTDGLDIPYVLGNFASNSGAVSSSATNVYPVPFLRNDGSHLLFTLPDKLSSGTTNALEYYDSSLQRFLPVTMTTAEKTITSVDGCNSVKVPIDLVRSFQVLPDDLQDELGNPNNGYVDSAGNFSGENSNIANAYDDSASTSATITGEINPSGQTNTEAGLTFRIKLPTPTGKITALTMTSQFDYSSTTSDGGGLENTSGLHVFINKTLTGNNANTSGAVDVLGSSGNPQTANVSHNASADLFSSLVTDNQMPEDLVLTFMIRAGAISSSEKQNIDFSIALKRLSFQITTTNDSSTEPIASTSFNAGINKLYLGSDINTPTFNQHSDADDDVDNPVSIHRELLKNVLSLDITDDTELNDSGYVATSDLRSSDQSSGKWASRLILQSPQSLEGLLRKLQYEGCFFFAFSPQEKQIGTGPSGLSRFRYFTIADSPSEDIQLSQNDISSYSLSMTSTEDLETHLVANFDRHPAENRYKSSDTNKSSTHDTIFENSNHSKKEVNLDLLFSKVARDTTNDVRNASWMNFRKSLFGEYKTIVNARIIDPEKYGLLEVGATISFGDITFGSLGDPFSEISDTFDSFVAMPSRLFDQSFANKEYYITSLTRGLGYTDVVAQEI